MRLCADEGSFSDSYMCSSLRDVIRNKDEDREMSTAIKTSAFTCYLLGLIIRVVASLFQFGQKRENK